MRSSENGVIPYQLQLRELDAILKNASLYLPFLAQQQCDGYTPAEKIRKTFEFRVPYYVGLLNDKAAHHWAVRSNTDSKEKIYPWNFNQLIDLDHSAEAFLVNLIGRCTYTGDPVLPNDSLLYSEYMLLNELNPLKIDGQPLSTEHKKQLIKPSFRWTFSTDWGIQKGALFHFCRPCTAHSASALFVSRILNWHFDLQDAWIWALYSPSTVLPTMYTQP